MTSSGKFSTGRDSGAGGLCQPPQSAQRWTQGLTVPVTCFKVEVVVHQQPGQNLWCYAFEVSDPHTREHLAQVVEPARRYSQVLGLVGQVVVDLRAALLELTDPDPF